MLLFRAKELLEGSSELLKAEAELAGTRLRRVLVRSLVGVVLFLFVLIGLLFLVAGTTMLLAHEVGYPISLLVHGGTLVTITICVWAWHARADPGEGIESAITEDVKEDEAMTEKEDAKERMSDAIDEDEHTEKSNPLPGVDKIKDEALEYAMRNPAVVAGAAMLVVSAIGPGRSLRLLARGITAASLMKSAIGNFTDTDGQDSEKDETSRPAGPPVRHPAHASGTSGNGATHSRMG